MQSLGAMTPLVLTAGMGLAGIVVWHAIPARRVQTRLIVQIPFFLAMSAMLAGWGVSPAAAPDGAAFAPAGLAHGLVKVLWWLHLAWALIGAVRIVLVIERRPREARLLQDIVVGVVYSGAGLSILAYVFAVPVATLIATSGAVAIIFGLALQSTLADVFSGVALNLGRPYALGDWIVLGDGTEGRVVETTWRSTHLLGFPNNLVVLPNSVLARQGVTNVSAPNESHSQTVAVRIAPTRPPAEIVETLRAAMAEAVEIVQAPPPSASIRAMDAMAIEVALIFRVQAVERRIAARNEVFDLVFRHACAAGLSLALPGAALVGVAPPPGAPPGAPSARRGA
ncbi:MAG: mechanosensitive ion channel family protein [Pseudomonadota bacterium]|nr:mechanosensitive ion channel family protein [Pseudomonadota bacterium]